MKGISLCADCAYYDLKKHKCKRGCTVDPDISKGEDVRFYVDCPLPDVISKHTIVTNGDRIRSMDNERLAEFFVKIIDCCSDGFMCNECPLDCAGGCYKPDIIAWLDKEASP